MTESHLDACIQRACETPSEPEIEFIQRDGHIVGIKLRATRESLSNLGGNMIDFAYGHLDDEFHHFPEGKDGTVDVQWVISDD